ncbi:Peptidase S8/S53 domain-containing protein [Artemisia annua]|uniref:Peptidase S8/S53 domain-containing protein n=1 Tax=Artemisia annua TaxID=35608 RepID=A0A2U1LFJ3_ARTAN|nr:Peptidase S8/S53 domain-containing protein [Artemisia annua]
MGLHMWYLSVIVFKYIMTIVDSSETTYIIRLNLSAIPKPYTSTTSRYLATLQSISDQSLAQLSTQKLLYNYKHAIQGFSVTLTSSELENIKRTPGYLFSTKDTSVQLLSTHSTEFLGLHYDFGAWPVSSYGKDVIIGFIDSGFWPESKCYNDDGINEIPSRWRGECETGTQFNSSLCNKKLIGARIFNKGYQQTNPGVKISMNSARDTSGHGTQTSSIASGTFAKEASYFGYGNGTAKGVAPHARLAIYKTFWNQDPKSMLSDILATIDQAIIDGVDVLSLSIATTGVPYWYNDPISIAVFTATEKGIFVSMACGNVGPYPLSVYNSMPWVLTVAAGTTDCQLTGVVTLGNGLSVPCTSLYHGSFSASQIPMYFMDECNNISDGAQNKIAVCFSENETLYSQLIMIQNSKALAGVFITDKEYMLDYYMQYDFPAVYLSLRDGRIVGDYIKEEGGQATGKISFRLTRLRTVTAPMVSHFSSRGPPLGFPVILKPDLMAPGQQILASWPYLVRPDRSLVEFNVDSGTSMACPHTAGLAAILKAVHPNWSPAAIRSAMMTTSSITDNTFNPIKEIIGDVIKEATPLAMGAGYISPNKALNPGLIYDMDVGDYVKFLCGLNFTMSQIELITRSSTYNCSNPTLDINYPSFIATFSENGTNTNDKLVKVFQRTLTSVENEMSLYRATFTGFNGFDVKVDPQTLIFTKKNDKKSYKFIIDQGPALKVNDVEHGFLSWVSTNGKIVVRRPVVAMGSMSYP